jgi:hypothetical protein
VVSFLFCKTQVLNFSTFEIEKLGLGRLCKRSRLQRLRFLNSLCKLLEMEKCRTAVHMDEFGKRPEEYCLTAISIASNAVVMEECSMFASMVFSVRRGKNGVGEPYKLLRRSHDSC